MSYSRARESRWGVAATKTFVAQVALLYSLALHLAELKGTLSTAKLSELRTELERLPGQLDHVVHSVGEDLRELAGRLAWSPFFL